ncbi:hypothetical protein DXU06_07065 [Bradyrhizobium elkanii]|uniref:hypothetical protein n=1 Tax=Bradyrhizobium elkanii TaxID=29448 RepID=UPI0003705C5C|nr:hypothetical protein [Bradyrhizobium elkanii]
MTMVTLQVDDTMQQTSSTNAGIRHARSVEGRNREKPQRSATAIDLHRAKTDAQGAELVDAGSTSLVMFYVTA